MRIHDYQGSFEVGHDEAAGLYRWRMLNHQLEPGEWQEDGEHATVRSAILAARAALEARRRRRLVEAVRDYFAQRLGHGPMQMTLDQLQIRGELTDAGLVAEDYSRRPSLWFALDVDGRPIEGRHWPCARKVRCKPPSGRLRP